MSASTLEFIEKVKASFAAFAASPARANITATDVTQYNVTVDGAVVRHLVFDLKEFVVREEAVANADIEITVADEDVIAIFLNKAQLVDLFAAGKITVKGDEALLKVLDERNQRHAAKAAAL